MPHPIDCPAIFPPILLTCPFLWFEGTSGNIFINNASQVIVLPSLQQSSKPYRCMSWQTKRNGVQLFLLVCHDIHLYKAHPVIFFFTIAHPKLSLHPFYSPASSFGSPGTSSNIFFSITPQ